MCLQQLTSVVSHVHISVPYGELESQTGGAPGRGIQGWEVRVEWSGGHRPAPASAAPPVTIRLGVMRLGVIILGVRPLDSGAGCIWVNSASSLDSLEEKETNFFLNKWLKMESWEHISRFGSMWINCKPHPLTWALSPARAQVGRPTVCHHDGERAPPLAPHLWWVQAQRGEKEIR